MDVEILSQRENPLLQRKEVKFRVGYAGAGSPGRHEVRNKLIAMLDAKKELTILDYLKPEYGRQASVGYVKIYENDSALKVEPKHQLKRNFEVKEKKKPAEAAAPAKAPEKKEEK
jgi:small subunit ribosomal protein S24e